MKKYLRIGLVSLPLLGLLFSYTHCGQKVVEKVEVRVETSKVENGASAPIEHMRISSEVINSGADDLSKDDICEKEFGSNYEAANYLEATIYIRNGGFQRSYFSVKGKVVAFSTLYGHPAGMDSGVFFLDTQINSRGTTNSKLVCVHKKAIIRFTEEKISSFDSKEVKDFKCRDSFGSSYKSAGLTEVLNKVATCSKSETGTFTVGDDRTSASVRCFRNNHGYKDLTSKQISSQDSHEVEVPLACISNY